MQDNPDLSELTRLRIDLEILVGGPTQRLCVVCRRNRAGWEWDFQYARPLLKRTGGGS